MIRPLLRAGNLEEVAGSLRDLSAWVGRLSALFVEKSDWLSWEPRYSASGSMTYLSVTTNFARYIVTTHSTTRTLRINVKANGITGGSASTSIRFSLPFTPVNAAAGYGLVSDGGSIAAYCVFSAGSNLMTVQRYDNANWGLGASRIINVSAVLEI